MSFGMERVGSYAVLPYTVNHHSENNGLTAPNSPESGSSDHPAEDEDTYYRLACEREADQDFQEAARLYRLAAQLNHVEAQLSLGDFYRIGRGVEQCDQEAVRWYELAAYQGNAQACLQLGWMCELKDDAKTAVRFYLLPSRTDDPESLGPESLDPEVTYRLGCLYEAGRGTDRKIDMARKLFQFAVEKGHPQAQRQLGWMYDTGTGVEKNEKEAIRLYSLAASQGDARAQFNLGLKFQLGQGVPQDDREAARWYSSAAIQNDKLAQCNLGFLYKQGRAVRQSDSKAARFYRLAANGGAIKGRYNLGKAYQEGRGVRQSDAKAIKHFKLAAEGGSAKAQRNLERLQQKRERMHHELQDERLSLSKRRVRIYQEDSKEPEVADLTSVNGVSNVALIHEKTQAAGQLNQRIPYQWHENHQANLEWINQTKKRIYQLDLLQLRSKQNDKETFQWYQRRADQGDASALYNLSLCYEEGRGVKQSDQQFLVMLIKAANKQNPRAQYKLGRELEKEERNCEQAIRWYRRAAVQQHMEAQVRFVEIFLEANSGSIAPEEAFIFCHSAALQGDTKAQEMLGNMYLEGKGVEKKYKAAAHWINFARKKRLALEAKRVFSEETTV